MTSSQRKYFTSQRSAQRQLLRPSYDPLTLSSHSEVVTNSELLRYGSSSNLLSVPISNKMKYSDMGRSPSASEVKSRQQLLRSTITKRKNEGLVSNLKSELQNLKLEVGKIMNKQDFPYSSRSGVHYEYEDAKRIDLGDYGKTIISDSVSVTSEKVIDEPLRKLQREYAQQNYDHAHYMELENNLLKTELRNLKNKYNATKTELKEKCEALQKKNQYLEISLKRSEDSVRQYKKSLEVEIQTIKYQLNRKNQQQLQQEQRKSQKNINAERDLTSGSGNELIQEKLKKLYEQLSEKSRIINNMNQQFNEFRGEIQKKSFELKKEQEKSNQLYLQLEFSKRENSRNKALLDQQVSKRNELTKSLQSLREKNTELGKHIQLKDKLVGSSEQMQKRLNQQLKQYKQLQQNLKQQNYEIKNELRKSKELNSTNEEQIKILKRTVNDFTSKIDQLTKSIRLQKEKNIQIEQNYRKMIDQIKARHENEILQTRKEFQEYKSFASQKDIDQEVRFQEKIQTDVKDKDKQINKWKVQYKMLKLKFQEFQTLASTNKQQMDTYYKSYKEYKTKNKVLEMKNKVLQDSADSYIEQIKEIQTQNLQERGQFIEQINGITMQSKQLERIIQSYEIQLQQTRDSLMAQTERANQQQIYRKELEDKVLNIDIEDNSAHLQIIQKIKKRVNEQDEKINKYIRQSKNRQNLINKLRQQIRDLMESQQKELQNFKSKQIKDIVEQIQSKALQSFENVKSQSKKQIEIEINSNSGLISENVQLKKENNEIKQKIIQLKQQMKNISNLYNLKSAEIEKIKDLHRSVLQRHEQKIQELEKTKNHQIQNLQTELNFKNQQNISYRNQIKIIASSVINLNRETFDQALKNQIQASKKLREQLSKKNQQVYRLRDSYAMMKADYDNLKSQSDINKLKYISEKKNLQVQFQVESHQLKNLLGIQQKKVGSLQQKIKLIIDENRKKDNFIQTYIMGKKLPSSEKQFVSAFLKEYQICLTAKNITERLQSQSQQLQKLTSFNFNLLKQLAQVKQKMALYEAAFENNEELGKNQAEPFDESNSLINLSANLKITN